ncbi:MAG: crossover junction endodeoxyribonuclease RuvC [Phycisphaerales bacterium]|nr:crossover junction endodeoxyribonuclease RuvC [Phycisphaerales bacterium]
MRIIGIDPGLLRTGYGCVDVADAAEPTFVEAGVFRLNSKTPMADRLGALHDDMSELLSRLEPKRIVVEKLYAHYKHPTTAIVMGHARGVILLAAIQRGIEVDELGATEVKKAITGFGHATKRQVQLAVQAQCGLAEPPSPVDVSDAIAIALCAARRVRPAPLM